MAEAGDLYGAKLEAFREAHELWSYHRNGKPLLDKEQVQNMRELSIRTHDEMAD